MCGHHEDGFVNNVTVYIYMQLQTRLVRVGTLNACITCPFVDILKIENTIYFDRFVVCDL